MKIKFVFAIFISLFFSIQTSFAFENFTALNDLNGEKKIEFNMDEFLKGNYVYFTHKTVKWEIQNAFSIQKTNHLGEINNSVNINAPLVFCKGMTFSLALSENWKLSYLFVAGFYRQNLPANFTPASIPYLQDDWISFNSEILLSRKIPISKRFSLSPFIGYDYSLFTFPEIVDIQRMNKKHSVITGAEISLRPANRVEISASAFTSLFFNMEPFTQSKIYAGTKFNASFSIYKFNLNIFNSIKFNFSKSSDNSNFSLVNFPEEILPFYSIEVGVGFRVAI